MHNQERVQEALSLIAQIQMTTSDKMQQAMAVIAKRALTALEHKLNAKN